MRKILDSYLLYKDSLVVGPDINHVRDCIEKSKTNQAKDTSLSVFNPDYWINRIRKSFYKIYYKPSNGNTFKYISISNEGDDSEPNDSNQRVSTDQSILEMDSNFG